MKSFMSDKKFEDLVLFKYRIIAQVLNDSGKGQMKYFKKNNSITQIMILGGDRHGCCFYVICIDGIEKYIFNKE